MPTTQILIVVGVALMAIGAIAARSKRQTTKKAYKFALSEALTENEQAMYWKLIAALPNHVVLAQVAASSIIKGKDMPSRGKIAAYSFDFVVCTKDLKPVAAIEIDDKTHDKPERQKADENKKAACEATGLKLIRWKSHKHPTSAEIQIAMNLALPKDTGVLRESMS